MIIALSAVMWDVCVGLRSVQSHFNDLSPESSGSGRHVKGCGLVKGAFLAMQVRRFPSSAAIHCCGGSG